ncbi:MAG: hypothetical protein GY722_17465 [bacterium]|nr:hypothetical protein [bacterium]
MAELRYKIKQPGLLGKLRGRPIRYEGPHGPAVVAETKDGTGTVVSGPNLPTATLPTTLESVGLVPGSWEYEGTIGSDTFVVSRDEPSFSKESYRVNVVANAGRYILSAHGMPGGTVWERESGSALRGPGRWFVSDVTPEEVAMTLVVGASGLAAQVNLHWM